MRFTKPFQALAVGDILLWKPILDLSFDSVVRWKSRILDFFFQFSKHKKVRLYSRWVTHFSVKRPVGQWKVRAVCGLSFYSDSTPWAHRPGHHQITSLRCCNITWQATAVITPWSLKSRRMNFPKDCCHHLPCTHSCLRLLCNWHGMLPYHAFQLCLWPVVMHTISTVHGSTYCQWYLTEVPSLNWTPTYGDNWYFQK